MTVWPNQMKITSNQAAAESKTIAIQKKTIFPLEELQKKKMMMKDRGNSQVMTSKKSCICAPTNHTGSFRCRLHRTSGAQKLLVTGGGDRGGRRYNTKNIVLLRGGGGLDNGQKTRLSRFAKAAQGGAYQDGYAAV